MITTTEFLKRYYEIDREIFSLDGQRTELILYYLRENREFQDGEKVKTYISPRKKEIFSGYAYIKNAYVDTRTGKICYNLLKAKKDGRKSKLDYTSIYDRLEKINPKGDLKQ